MVMKVLFTLFHKKDIYIYILWFPHKNCGGTIPNGEMVGQIRPNHIYIYIFLIGHQSD